MGTNVQVQWELCPLELRSFTRGKNMSYHVQFSYHNTHVHPTLAQDENVSQWSV